LAEAIPRDPQTGKVKRFIPMQCQLAQPANTGS